MQKLVQTVQNSAQEIAKKKYSAQKKSWSCIKISQTFYFQRGNLCLDSLHPAIVTFPLAIWTFFSHIFSCNILAFFFAEILHSLAKQNIPEFRAKSGNLRNFFYVMQNAWWIENCGIFAQRFFFRWKSWSQLKNLTSDYNAMKCWQSMLPLIFFIFYKNFFNKQSNCLVFSALSFIGKMLKCYLSRSLIWTGNQGTASELSWNITFLKNVSSN